MKKIFCIGCFAFAVVIGLLGVTSASENMDLVNNGNFEQGNTGFTSDYEFEGGGVGGYWVDLDAGNVNYWFSGGDHTTGEGLYMIVDGAYNDQLVLWSQEIDVQKNSNYELSFYYRKVDWPKNDIAVIQVTINGEQIGLETTVADESWSLFSATWNSGESNSALIEIRDLLVETNGNGGDDFGLDDIAFIGPALSSFAGASTWSQTGGPGNGKIANIIVDPTNSDVIIAGTIGDGVYKSTNQGATWQQINSGLPGDSDTYLVSMDPMNSGILYVGTVGGGIFKSTDGGESWSAINTGLTNLNVHMAPVIDPTNTSVLYVGTEGPVFKSTNGGASWSESNNGLTEEYEVCAIAVDPSNSSIVYAGMYYDGYTEGGIFKSTDAGQNWLSSSIGLSTEALKVNSLTIAPEDSQTIYVTADNGVIKSVDGGESWKFINNGLTNQEVYGLAISPLNSEIILVGTWGGGVFHTADGGETWVSDNDGLFNLTVIGIAFDTLNPTTLYAGTCGDGVFKSYSDIDDLPSEIETYTVLSEEHSSITIQPSSYVQVFGTQGNNVVNVKESGRVCCANFIGENEVNIQGNSFDFTGYRSGATVYMQSRLGTIIRIPATLTPQVMRFSDGSSNLVISSDQIFLGHQIIGTIESAVESPVDDSDTSEIYFVE